jgi:predicted permease
MSSLIPAFRYALRRLARAPLFSVLVILTLAPGIGAHVAIFSLVNTLFLRPLPLRDAGQVVGVYQTREGTGYFPLSLPDYLDYRAASTAFSGLASHYPTAPVNLAVPDGTLELNGSVVSGNYFSVLGIEPARGRLILPTDDGAPGSGAVAVISHKLWQSRFEGRADIAGQTLTLNKTPFVIVGVAPAAFEGVLLGVPTDVWVPNSMASAAYRWCDTKSRDCSWTSMIGRLKPGRTLREAQAEMTVLSGRLATEYRDTDHGLGLSVAPLRGVHPSARSETMRLAALLLAAVSLVVAVACANACGLLLVRGLTRRKEIAIRLAIGATRLRVVSPFLVEALLLALLGGGTGVLMASWFGRVIVGLYPSDVPLDLRIDPLVLGYAALLSVLTGLIVGVIPALQSTRPNLVTALKEEVTAAAHGRPRTLGLLIVVQVALCFVLLTCTGLLLRSVTNAGHGGGFDPRAVVSLRLRPLLVDYTPGQGQAFSREALRRLEGVPGVLSVSLAVSLPPWLPGDPIPIELPGQKPDRPQDAPTAWTDRIAPRFFKTLGVPILRGRDFDDHDGAGGARVAIVNQTLSRRLWPGGDALGQSLVIEGNAYSVVGLVPDMAQRNAQETAAAQVYLPFWQNAELIDARLCVRTDGDPDRIIPALRRELNSIDPKVPVVEVETMTGSLDKFFAPVRVTGSILAAAAGLALLLSAVGLYGILSLAVAQRTRDIGIRIALGASRREVVTLVVRDSIFLVLAALAVGLVCALGVTSLLAHYLYGVSPHDPLTFGVALVLLGLTAAIASWVPAQRASRINPLLAIRQS